MNGSSMTAGGSNRGIDPVTTSVIQGALENIATEMGHKLMRMSYSSIIRESEDFGAGIVDPSKGRGWPNPPSPLRFSPVPIPGYVQGMLRQMAERGDANPPRRRDHAQRRLRRREPRPRRRLHRARVPRRAGSSASR